MKSSLIAFATIGLLAFNSTEAKSQEIANDAYKNWAQFKVGTSATLKLVSKMGDKVVSNVKMVQKLIEKNDKQVVVEISTTIVVNGMEIKAPANKVTHKANVKNTIDKPANLPKDVKFEQTGKGKEKVKVGDKSYDCNWVSNKSEFSGIKSDTKIWMSDQVPGMVVKTTVKTSSGINTTTELVEFTKK